MTKIFQFMRVWNILLLYWWFHNHVSNLLFLPHLSWKHVLYFKLGPSSSSCLLTQHRDLSPCLTHCVCSVWLWGTDPPNSLLQEIVLYGACVLIGASGATLQVTSFAMVSDVISTTTVSRVAEVG